MQGLQVFDENGDCTVDVTTRLTRYLGTFTIAGGKGGEITNDLFADSDYWIVLKEIGTFPSKINISNQAFLPTFKKEGNRLTWTWDNADETFPEIRVLYGVY